MSKRSTAVLDTPQPEYAPDSSRSSSPRRSSTKLDPRLRRDTVEDFASYNEDEDEDGRPRRSPRQRDGNPRSQLKLKFRNRIPTSVIGRVFTGIALLMILGAIVSLLMVTRTFLLHDPRFMIQSPAAIEIQGNKHLTRAQLLSIFGEDVERNIFRISLDDRQAELEALPWVKHATVMRLLPGRIRVSIVERTPIAFVRQGGHIGLVDREGILLDMSAGSQTEPAYSFPVVTGVSSGDPASTRTARMRIFERFTADLDSTGEKISEHLSDVDLSNPEDVKALIPDHSTEVLVHFGDEHFLDRYRKFQELLPQWHAQYPNLASVDMRYEREVVLDMAKPGTARADEDGKILLTKAAPPQSDTTPKAPAEPMHRLADRPKAAAHPPARPPVKHPAKATAHAAAKPYVAPRTVTHPVATTSTPANKPVETAHTPTAAPALTPVKATPSASAAARSSYPVAHTVTTPTPKPAATRPAAAKPAAASSQVTKAPAPSTAHGKPSAGKPLASSGAYQPPQVATP